MRPTPEDLGRQTQKAAQDTLASIRVLSIYDTALSAFLALFTLLEEKQVTTPRSRL